MSEVTITKELRAALDSETRQQTVTRDPGMRYALAWEHDDVFKSEARSRVKRGLAYAPAIPKPARGLSVADALPHITRTANAQERALGLPQSALFQSLEQAGERLLELRELTDAKAAADAAAGARLDAMMGLSSIDQSVRSTPTVQSFGSAAPTQSRAEVAVELDRLVPEVSSAEAAAVDISSPVQSFSTPRRAR